MADRKQVNKIKNLSDRVLRSSADNAEKNKLDPEYLKSLKEEMKKRGLK